MGSVKLRLWTRLLTADGFIDMQTEGKMQTSDKGKNAHGRLWQEYTCHFLYRVLTVNRIIRALFRLIGAIFCTLIGLNDTLVSLFQG